ncbi:MAG TPA: type VI secretion system membrane subunit TssM [Burkholderiaceae bacterium]|nr:type VI secretion system membrane subunit TssM [Burkholderiaceae bacterium]
MNSMTSSRPSYPLRFLIPATGVIALCALVWFVGPLVAVGSATPLVGERARWITIGMLLTLVAGWWAWRTRQRAQDNRQLLDGLAQGAAPAPGEEEVALLGKRFEEAVSVLKHSRIGDRRPLLSALAGRPFVYQLPWYVIIGAPGAGKTTALLNSGLEFPLASHVGEKVAGIGGTRNCDWWFASDAVLIDTAGRYATQDSHREADRTAWLGFLDLLVRYRPRRPLNGVLLTVSASDLLGGDAQARLAHAKELRERIDELYSRFGVKLPIYVLVTKTDLLAGFVEFFADFDKDERAQVWGVTFPYEGQGAGTDPTVLLNSEFAALEKRLHECMFERMHAETDRERRAAIYAFPQQWRLLRETLYEFLQAVLGPGSTAGPTPATPVVRGVYFTSATQEGRPMDRALGELARALGLATKIVAPLRPSGKTFFVTRLLRDVVFAESTLAGTNLQWERRRAWAEVGLVAASACAVIAVSTLASQAYLDNRDHIAEVSARLAPLQAQVSSMRLGEPAEVATLLPALDGLEALARPSDVSPRSTLVDMTLDRREMLSSAAHDAYRGLLKEAFLPRIAARLEDQLRASGRDHVELIYEALRAYLMLFAGKNFDAPALRGYLHADWEATLPPSIGPVQRNGLQHHLDQLLAGGEVGAPSQADPRLVEQARSVVASVPLAERAYRRLSQIGLAGNAASFTVESAAGPSARRVFVRASGRPLSEGVPAFYMRAAMQQGLRDRMREVLAQFEREQAWVMGHTSAAAATATKAALPGTPPDALVEEVARLYRADYIRHWDGLLSDIRLVTPASLATSTEIASILARADSPLLALMRSAARELSVGPTSEGEDVAIDPRFEPLKRYAASQPAPIEQAQAALAALATHLAAVEDAARRKVLPQTSDAVRALTEAAGNAPEPVHAMLSELASASGAQVIAALRDPLNRQIAADLAPTCARVTSGRYPLMRSASEDLSRDDFVRTFGSGGLFDAFFQRHLAPYVDTATRPWSLRFAPRGDTSEALQQFQRAQAIREAFFSEGGRRFGTRLEMKLIELDPDLAEFAIDVDGQVLRFRRGAQGPQTLQWPGPGGAGRVRLLLATQGGSGSSFGFEGPWSLLHLLDRVRVERAGPPDHFQLLFDVEGRKARFDVRAPSPINAALRAEMEQFQCPRRL